MKRSPFISRLLMALVLWAGSYAPGAFACAACYGQSDSAMAKGMNMGIMAMIGVIGVVLSGVASFIVFLAYKNRKP